MPTVEVVRNWCKTINLYFKSTPPFLARTLLSQIRRGWLSTRRNKMPDFPKKRSKTFDDGCLME